MFSVKLLLIIAIILFIVSSIAGTFLPNDFKDRLYNDFREKVRDVIGEGNFSLNDLLMLPLKIFFNNLIVVLIIYALSVTIIGSWIFFIVQGLLIGAIITAPSLDLEMLKQIESVFPKCTLDQKDLVYIKISLLIPHGIFEIPGITLGLIASYFVSMIIIDYIRKRFLKRDIDIDVKTRILGSLKLLLFSIIFLIVAAFIEVFITPIIGGLVMHILCFTVK